jgi:tetratricopeptide (TPR) repeat protein
VYDRENFPIDWARTQHNLGNAYSIVSNEDLQNNLLKAIASYEAALQVFTRDMLPVDWAVTQYNRGNAYRDLLIGDRETNLRNATLCYSAALYIFRSHYMETHIKRVMKDLNKVQHALRSLG